MFIGIDWERKGGPLMIEAFRLLRERLPDAELAIVGCSPRVEGPGVRIIGYLSPHRSENRRRIAELMDESRCLCLLSHFDPMPNAIIEAYSFGLPVVALNTGSRGEVVEHGGSGLLCQDERPETIAGAMEQLLTDDALAERTGERARQLHIERFNWQAVVGRMCRVIKEA
jgi:glycosyltransferase involved in cell wall biosynthesis